MKYVLMFAQTEEYAAELAALDDLDREKAYDKVRQWFAEHHEQIIHHSYLMPPETATTLRLDGSEPLVSDGPFIEGKEIISGIAEIDVADLDQALRVAKAWPGCPLVEIRPLAG
jgi:hypothetical protein